MKNVKLIVPIISLVCAAVVCGAVLLWAPVCAGTLELANGNMVPMRCAYTGKVAVLLALVLAAILLRGGEQKSESSIFWFGVILGGAYEYVCSAVTELLFGTVFWDYSGFKFNLGGRINLLYCFFWGIAAVTWIRYGYPLVAKGMKAVKRRIRPWMTALLAVFMAVNLVTSALALARYDARTSGAAPANAVDVLLDEHFDNARMERIYPNAKKVTKAE